MRGPANWEMKNGFGRNVNETVFHYMLRQGFDKLNLQLNLPAQRHAPKMAPIARKLRR